MMTSIIKATMSRKKNRKDDVWRNVKKVGSLIEDEDMSKKTVTVVMNKL